MKLLARILIIFVAQLLAAASSASTTISSEEEGLTKLPTSIYAVVNQLDTDGDCIFTGKRVKTLSHSRQQLWFVTNSCQGSGGGPIILVLVSPSGPKVVLDAGTDLDITIYDKLINGLPIVSVEGGGLSFGLHETTYHFDGKEYKPVSKTRFTWTNSFSETDLPSEVNRFLLKTAKGSPCLKDQKSLYELFRELHVNWEYGNNSAYIFSASCEDQEKTSYWVVMGGTKPRLILQTENDADGVRIGPGVHYGVSDLCLLDLDKYSSYDIDRYKGKSSDTCWSYNGNIYVEKAKALPRK